jgi:hypothetical protein
VIRVFIGLLLGIIIGAVATTYFFSTGGGDYFVVASPRVRHLEEELSRAGQQQERLTKKLEDAAAVIEKMSAKFTDLEHRVQTLQLPSTKPADTESSAKPSTEESPLNPAPAEKPSEGVDQGIETPSPS